jgi:hypothetical protein
MLLVPIPVRCQCQCLTTLGMNYCTLLLVENVPCGAVPSKCQFPQDDNYSSTRLFNFTQSKTESGTAVPGVTCLQ